MLKPLSTLYKTLAVAAVLGGGMNQAAAHDIYIWPSFFSVNGDKATAVPVDLAASHTPFRGDFSLSKNGLSVYGVDGKEIRDTGAYYQGERRSSFDLKVSEPGTYAVVYSRDPSFFTSYTIGKKDTKKHHRGNKSSAKKALPNDAKNVKTSKYTTISIAYITNKAPSKEVLEAKNEGYELVAVTHPADYVTNEKIAIKLLLNGKPVKGQELTIEREGTQYRASADVLELTSNKKGLVEFTLPVGGRYMLESVHEQKSTDPEADTDTTRVFYSFEVIHE